MTEQIKKEILLLEEQYNIKVLYAVESGSRAWGFASKDSDWDVRFIYIHRYDWYLSVDDIKDNINIILPNDIDLAGWEIRKALLLYKKSNPPLMEWLCSPIIYKDDGSFAERLRDASKQYFNPKACIYHYLHMAQGNHEAYFKENIVRVKKYFYVLRPILAACWIEKHKTMAPMEFEELLADQEMEAETRTEIQSLLKRKMDGNELAKEKKITPIDRFIEDKLFYFSHWLKNYQHNVHINNAALNNIFRSSLQEAWPAESATII